jgi:hypothetical protein
MMLQFAPMTMAPKCNQTTADAPCNRVTVQNLTTFADEPRKRNFPGSDRLDRLVYVQALPVLVERENQ